MSLLEVSKTNSILGLKRNTRELISTINIRMQRGKNTTVLLMLIILNSIMTIITIDISVRGKGNCYLLFLGMPMKSDSLKDRSCSNLFGKVSHRVFLILRNETVDRQISSQFAVRKSQSNESGECE